MNPRKERNHQRKKIKQRNQNFLIGDKKISLVQIQIQIQKMKMEMKIQLRNQIKNKKNQNP